MSISVEKTLYLKNYLAILCCFFLFACADEPQAGKKDKEQAASVTECDKSVAEASCATPVTKHNNAPSTPAAGDKASTPLNAEDARLADRMIGFSNQARDILSGGTYRAATVLKDNAQRYLEIWRLGKRPRLPARHNGDTRLKPPAGLFDKEEEALLTQSLDRMDKALNDLITHYRSLEKYAADSAIKDDGKLGSELNEKIKGAHQEFMNAKKSWLEIVERRAEEAEAKFLATHPLQRQIQAAGNIFSQMREIGDLVEAEGNNREAIKSLRVNLDLTVAEAAKPPFPASPSLERVYRDFLKKVNVYCQILDRALVEGFHNIQKRELADARLKCLNAYNEFVSTVNNSTRADKFENVSFAA